MQTRRRKPRPRNPRGRPSSRPGRPRKRRATARAPKRRTPARRRVTDGPNAPPAASPQPIAAIRDRLKTLIREKCVLYGDFVLASGQRSKVFFDCKRATLDAEGVHLIATLILDQIDRLAREDRRPIDAIGGPTIGADPVVGHVTGLSWRRPAGAPGTGPLRGFLVRKESKDHGTGRLIENDIPRGSRVVVFEDVVTTGGSTLAAIRKVEDAGLQVAAVLAVVDREQGGTEALARYRYFPLFRKSEFGL